MRLDEIGGSCIGQQYVTVLYGTSQLNYCLYQPLWSQRCTVLVARTALEVRIKVLGPILIHL